MESKEITKKEAKELREFAFKNLSQKPNPKDRFKIKDKFISKFGGDLETRNEFTRDKDRIIYSKSFRRLQHKAQVHSYEKGDFYRTRLTHTLEVTQIARALASNIGLNMDLTEAIALGHDIGHTPFGHAGEMVLDSVMRGEDDLGKQILKIDYGGFKHNFNSIKILDVVEKEYPDEKGLNLTWQVLEGILKHTKIEKQGKKWNWKRFVNHEEFIQDFIYSSYYEENTNKNYKTFSFTAEGQIVNIADEIAQREHDLDECFKNHHFQSKFSEYILKIIELSIEESNDSSEIELYNLKELKKEFKNIKSDKNSSFKGETMTKLLLSYFIADVTRTSLEKIKQIKKEDIIDDYVFDYYCESKDYSRRYVTSEIITFSKSGKKFNDLLENLINNRIVNSEEVNRFDGKSTYILRQLFKACSENPLQMPKRQLELLQKFIKCNSEKFYDLEVSNDIQEELNQIQNLKQNKSIKKVNKKISNIKFITVHSYNPLSSKIPLLIDILKLKNLDQLILPKNFSKENIIEGQFEEKYFNEKVLKINEKEKEQLFSEDEFFIKCLLENHYAYMEVICDYISKMTDNFAKEEYKKLYIV